jgi:hypothetical protein
MGTRKKPSTYKVRAVEPSQRKSWTTLVIGTLGQLMAQICTLYSSENLGAGLYGQENKSALHAEPSLCKPHLPEMGKLHTRLAQMHALLERSAGAGLYCQ